MIDYPVPLLGISAFSGTGKTTLLTQLLPVLKADGLRLAVVKHAQHQFEIDHPQKDSYELRKAGAAQMLVASRGRMALISDIDDSREPDLLSLLTHLNPEALDLILVEGFKREALHKIELHRPSLGKPLLCRSDPNIIAIATDQPISCLPDRLPVLDLNNISAIAEFIRCHLYNTGDHPLDDESHRTQTQLR